MSAGLPMLGQWIIGLPVTLTGHAVYRLPGGKTKMRDPSEFVGEVICSFCDLQMLLKRVVKYQFPVEALTAMLAGEVFILDAVLDDFSWRMSKASPANTRGTDLYLDRD